VALVRQHQGHLITTISQEDMTMTTTNDSKQTKNIGAQLLQLFAAYEGLPDLIQLSESERALFGVLNRQFLSILDQADEVGLLP